MSAPSAALEDFMSRSTRSFFIAVALTLTPLAPPAAHADNRFDYADPAAYRALEQAILQETNLLRRDPRAYARKLAALRPSYQGNRILRGPNQPAIATVEGVAALDEAIAALRKGPRRLPRLARSQGLELAARAHADDLARSGGLGHEGSDGSSPAKRVTRVGTWDGLVAENISFGPIDAEEIVIGLIVDDGVPDRGHRDVLLTRELFFAGVACGPHPSYKITCVMNYATSFKLSAQRPRERGRPPTHQRLH
jgi:uncharacterized protein YkwD